ncbi:hypothetical protein BDP81DRAFT_65667 [Colletotrichum phormii]|uniref:Uncharacterized protein n=1 Tax=Colletotrichum phormii TaxID=359342 RepID=A0AAI9ZLH4_9PEZI|nr:uncharacterized protein BDP81DRAFT_65667 [Colletotrichum phormii]KAK1634099.1 hypothetical protein BDP81DRAFT_65667 [Colletotrichum phormii]
MREKDSSTCSRPRCWRQTCMSLLTRCLPTRYTSMTLRGTRCKPHIQPSRTNTDPPDQKKKGRGTRRNILNIGSRKLPLARPALPREDIKFFFITMFSTPPTGTPAAGPSPARRSELLQARSRKMQASGQERPGGHAGLASRLAFSGSWLSSRLSESPGAKVKGEGGRGRVGKRATSYQHRRDLSRPNPRAWSCGRGAEGGDGSWRIFQRIHTNRRAVALGKVGFCTSLTSPS